MKIILKYFYLLSILFIYSPDSYCQSAIGGLSAEQIYKKVSNAVVVVQAYNSNDELTMQGSGVVLNDKGYVVTNYHVLSGNERLEILHGKEIIPYADIIGIDVEKDILILKINAKKFPSIKVGSSKLIKIGQRVYAIGSPLGFENTISEGIISGIRSYDELKREYIQITASISSGSSGGAVVNDKGELIGISTLTIKEGQNINFAIPIDDVLKVEIRSYTKHDEYKDFELFNKGRNAYEIGDYEEGIKYYTLFIAKYQNDVSGYFSRGTAKAKNNDLTGAFEDFNKGIELSPLDARLYYNRGTVLSKLEDYISSLQDFDKAIELDPNFEFAYNNRSAVKFNLEDYEGAFQDAESVVNLNPISAQGYASRGNARAKLGNYKAAIQDFNKAIELDPSLEEVYVGRGGAKTRLQDYRGAVEDCDQAIWLNPNYPIAYNNRGLAELGLKYYSDAIKDFNRAIELDPNIAEAYSNRGFAKNYLPDYGGAIKDFNRAIELGYSDPQPYYLRGLAKIGLKNYFEAVQDYNQSIKLYPNNAVLYFGRAVAKHYLGDKMGACLDWSKAGELGEPTAYDFIKQYCN